MADLPSGTVTFLLSDIEGSTALWEEATGPMRVAVARHDELFEVAVAEHGGVDVKPRGEGDSRFAVFARAADAISAAVAIQRSFETAKWPTPRPIRVRIGIHTGEAQLREGDYYGSAVNRCARIRGIGHGGQILASEATWNLAREDLGSGVEAIELGKFQLRDLSRPETVFQVTAPGLRAEFPALTSLDARSHNLPVQPTALVGRDRETAAIVAVLSADGARLVTLTGPGGTGKTRLGIHVATQLVGTFDDGIAFVDLSPITDPALVPATIASSLGLQDSGGRPLQERLTSYLRGRSTLLILDNFEQVLDAASVVATLIEASPGLKVVATSRAPLELRGEREFPVPPLDLPEAAIDRGAEELAGYASVALFLERARAVRPDFTLTDENARSVAEICRRLDGLPLAIELAAARMRLLSPRAMLARLGGRLDVLAGGPRDAPTRHRALRTTIAWSYDLLNDEEQRLFRYLSAFVGGFSLEAAESIADIDGDVFEGVASLAAKSLVRPIEGYSGEPRYTMLETIREFGLELLASTGELNAARARHALFFRALAQRAAPQLTGAGQQEWLGRLEFDHDNLRAALSWTSTSSVDGEVGLELAGALTLFWLFGGDITEGRGALAVALATTNRQATPARAWALMGAGLLAQHQSAHDEARMLAEESLAISRDLGDKLGVAWALSVLQLVARSIADYARSTELATETLGYFRDLDDAWGITWMLRNLGALTLLQGRLEESRRYTTESLAVATRAGDTLSAAVAHDYLGRVSLHESDLAGASEHLNACLDLSRTIGYRLGVTRALNHLGRVAISAGDPKQATETLTECLFLQWHMGDVSGIASVIEALASAAVLGRRLERAARLLGAADSLRAAIETPLPPVERSAYERDLSLVRAGLGDAGFDAAWSAGREQPLESVIAYVRDE